MPLARATQQDGASREPAGTGVLMGRLGPPSLEAVDIFRNAGMENVRAHILTVSERAKVETVLASLPTLHKRVLESKLHRLAFVDGIPGEGTGLTSLIPNTGLYDVTLRASILEESLSTFLTSKERRVFRDDGSGISVSVEASGTDALTYVLLHESTHVMDMGCGLTAKSGNHFVAGIWTRQNRLVPLLAASAAAATVFRRGRPREVGEAAGVYDALAETPFVSLYATATASEDFAELVAWREIQEQHHGDLTIKAVDAGAKTVRLWKPLTFSQVQKRFSYVDELLASSPFVCKAHRL